MNRKFLLRFSKHVQSIKSKWLMFLSERDTLRDIFNEVDIPINCEFIAAQHEEGIVHLTEVYRVHPTFDLQVRLVGEWSYEDGLTCTNTHFLKRRNDFQGLVFRAAVSYEQLFTLYLLHVNNIHFLIFCYSTKYMKSELDWGMEKNGTWTGVIGLVQRNEVDVAIASLTISTTRLQAVDFLLPLMTGKGDIYIREPEESRMYWNIFLAPFKWKLWSAVLASLLLLSGGLWFICFIGRRQGVPESQPYGLFNSLHCVYSGLLAQGQNSKKIKSLK
ncbi:hypothetical protein ANN_16584 [Periplaneta americana]|uniref:Uncharacterized protein n=1 Tax=Periplaneta americana TaxID=6978 RepID=A0ABQ8SSB2_PERAM|nr:hypothetical protein ANN_16584 [Periplaneta americana]